MNKTSPATGALLAAFAAAALLQGCRTQQPGTPSRRTLFGGPTVPDVEVPAAVVRDGTGRPAPRPQPGPAPRPVLPEDGEILNPGEPVDTVPAPVRAPVPAAVPPAGPAGAGADSYRRYMGGDAPAPAPVRPAPAHPAPVQATGASVRPAPAPAPAPSPAPASENYRIHVVQSGESAGKIANANGMTLAEFVQVNGISDPNRLFEGQKVRVYAGRAPLSGRPAPASDPTEGGRYHVVRAGETLSSIAVLHNTSVGELQRLNRIADLNRIREGQRLALPGAGATPPPPPTPVSPRPPVPPTTRPVVTPPTRPPVTPPTRPTPPPPPVREPTEPGIVEIGGTQVNSRELLAPGGSLMDVVTPEPPAATPPTPPTPTTRPPAPPTPTTRPPAPPTQAAVPAGAREYVVKDGEDLYSIGLAIGAKPYQIRLLNEGRNLEGLQPGDRIFVPAE